MIDCLYSGVQKPVRLHLVMNQLLMKYLLLVQESNNNKLKLNTVLWNQLTGLILERFQLVVGTALTR